MGVVRPTSPILQPPGFERFASLSHLLHARISNHENTHAHTDCCTFSSSAAASGQSRNLIRLYEITASEYAPNDTITHSGNCTRGCERHAHTQGAHHLHNAARAWRELGIEQTSPHREKGHDPRKERGAALHFQPVGSGNKRGAAAQRSGRRATSQHRAFRYVCQIRCMIHARYQWQCRGVNEDGSQRAK